MSALKNISSLKAVQTYLYKSVGWEIDFDEKTFEIKMSSISDELGYINIDSLIESLDNLRTDKNTIQAFARAFSVGESYFFRDHRFFELFEHVLIPKILEKHEKRLNIWSVGCSRGEEAYSIAMVLHRNIPDIQNWNIFILATDINPDVLESGRNGLYSKWSLRRIDESYKNQYFRQEGEWYQIDPTIKKMVHFKYHNIAAETVSCTPSIGGKYNLILFENVLIYLEEKQSKQIVHNLYSMLDDGGCLVTTATEYSSSIFDFPHLKCAADAWIIQKPYPLDLLGMIFDTQHQVLLESLAEDLGDEETETIIEDMSVTPLPEIPIAENNHRHYYHDAIKMLEVGEIENAKSTLKMSLYYKPDCIVSCIALGNIYRKEGKYEIFMKYIQKAKELLLKMEPQNEVAHSDGITAIKMTEMLNAIKEDILGY